MVIRRLFPALPVAAAGRTVYVIECLASAHAAKRPRIAKNLTPFKTTHSLLPSTIEAIVFAVDLIDTKNGNIVSSFKVKREKL